MPIELRDRLKEASRSLGHPSVPRMLESWLGERTGTGMERTLQPSPRDP